jgi:anti-sigma-K factor RskA
MTHAEAVELLGAFALDAVDGDERAQVEDHLRDCPRCRAELMQHREVAAHLSYVGAPAPSDVWGRIAAELAPPPPARMYPLRRTRLVTLTAAAAAVIVVAVAVLGWQLRDEQHKVDALQAQLGSPQLTKLMNAASVDPTSLRVTLASPDHRVRVSVVVAADGTGYLASNGTLAALPNHETYQLWGTTGDRTVSLGIIGGHPSVVAFPDPITNLSAMALTAERAGGVVQTTNVPIAIGSVR